MFAEVTVRHKICIGVWCNGSITVSKTVRESSSLSTPALSVKWYTRRCSSCRWVRAGTNQTTAMSVLHSTHASRSVSDAYLTLGALRAEKRQRSVWWRTTVRRPLLCVIRVDIRAESVELRGADEGTTKWKGVGFRWR